MSKGREMFETRSEGREEKGNVCLGGPRKIRKGWRRGENRGK